MPVRSVSRSTYPKWFSPRLRYLIRAKKRAHKAYKQSGAYSDYLTFSSLRAQCKVNMDRDHRVYIDGVESSVLEDVSSFWMFVNTKRGCQGIPCNMELEQTSAATPSAVADLFAVFFGSVYIPPSGVGPAVDPAATSDGGVNIHTLSIDISEIYSKLNSLDANKTPGFDGIPPRLLKECCFILSRPLWHIFNSSLVRGVFPTVWKSSLSPQYLRRETALMLEITGQSVNYHLCRRCLRPS